MLESRSPLSEGTGRATPVVVLHVMVTLIGDSTTHERDMAFPNVTSVSSVMLMISGGGTTDIMCVVKKQYMYSTFSKNYTIALKHKHCFVFTCTCA